MLAINTYIKTINEIKGKGILNVDIENKTLSFTDDKNGEETIRLEDIKDMLEGKEVSMNFSSKIEK